LDVVKCLGHLFIEDVGVACRRLDVSVIERSLHELEVAGIPKQLRTHVVSDVMEAEVLNPRLLPKTPPLRLCVDAPLRVGTASLEKYGKVGRSGEI